MTKISRKEVLQIAAISAIALREDEIDPMMKKLDQVLSYAHQVTKVAVDLEEPSTKNSNQMRDDLVIQQNSAPILAQAPEREGDYFVVPMILDN